MRNSIDLKRNQKMFEMRQDGMTLQEIGEVFGITRERVRQIIRRDRPDLISYTAGRVRIDKIVDQFSEGKTPTEIAKEFKITRNTVRYHLNKLCPEEYDEYLRKIRKRPVNKNEDILRELASKGYSKTEAAREIGCSSSYVSEVASHAEIDFRDGRRRTGDMAHTPNGVGKKLFLRMPKSLHRALAEEAAEEGVGLNDYIVVLVAQNRHIRPLNEPYKFEVSA